MKFNIVINEFSCEFDLYMKSKHAHAINKSNDQGKTFHIMVLKKNLIKKKNVYHMVSGSKIYRKLGTDKL